MASKLYQFIWVFLIVMIVGALLYRSLMTENNEAWERTGFENLKAGVQEGLAQMHWQWQYEGRPSSITYESSNAGQSDQIEMNREGWPKLNRSLDACQGFLAMFAAKSAVNVGGLSVEVDLQKQLEVQVEFIAQAKAQDSQKRVDICRYSRPEQKFDYHLGTGNVF
ncbi:MAG: hypothetical protein ABNH21_03390 [Glaciecola sp.]|jgi:hypothetical protein